MGVDWQRGDKLRLLFLEGPRENIQLIREFGKPVLDSRFDAAIVNLELPAQIWTIQTKTPYLLGVVRYLSEWRMLMGLYREFMDIGEIIFSLPVMDSLPIFAPSYSIIDGSIEWVKHYCPTSIMWCYHNVDTSYCVTFGDKRYKLPSVSSGMEAFVVGRALTAREAASVSYFSKIK